MQAGEALEELEEVTGSATGKDAGAAAAAPAPPASLVDRAKQVVFASVQRYGFIAIFLAASIPNPVSCQCQHASRASRIPLPRQRAFFRFPVSITCFFWR